MRWLLLLALAACDTSSSTLSDFGVVLPGCRAPNQCWRTECNCIYANFNNLASNDPLGCLLCDPNQNPTDPTNGTCDCSSDDGGLNGQCIERAQVCVGHGPVCNGLCVRSTSMLGCMDPTAEPPQEVATVTGGDGGPGTERRCAYSDDICCD
jgi:hypothetical protein